jgi:hypothetical protein
MHALKQRKTENKAPFGINRRKRRKGNIYLFENCNRISQTNDQHIFKKNMTSDDEFSQQKLLSLDNFLKQRNLTINIFDL